MGHVLYIEEVLLKILFKEEFILLNKIRKSMNILDIIAKKRDGKKLSKEEIEYFVRGYTSGEVADYQAAALIMAVYIKGMTDEELFNLTFSMANSGDVLDLSEFGEAVVDKHSTGGVGDKVSIIVLPIVASCGVPVAKMSGRGLGFTGGTVDKLEAIPGFNTNVDIEKFKEYVHKIGISMIGQTMNLAPADKKIYALRDTINCVDNIPLIASSIMSKKIASGANKIVLEVTYGKGAFMKNIEDAKLLANKMEKLGGYANLEVKSIFTPMDEPIGYAVGNTLEIIEAINFLKGKDMPSDLKGIVLEIGSQMIKLAGLGENLDENKEKMLKCIENGLAFEKFKEMVGNQQGDTKYLDNIDEFEKAKYILEVKSKKVGVINDINAEDIGKVACSLGAGRIKKEDIIDMSVGVVLNKKVHDFVQKNDVLAFVYANNEEKANRAVHELEKIFIIE